MNTLLIIYKKTISPVITYLAGGSVCRFTPTCSEYASEALKRYGLAKGGLLAFKRVIRCNPLGGSGFDPLK